MPYGFALRGRSDDPDRPSEGRAMQGVPDLLEAYRLAHERFDVAESAGFYRLPCSIVTKSRGWIVRDRAALERELGRMFELYGWSGVERMEMDRLRVGEDRRGVNLVSVAWRLLGEEDQEVVVFDMTYALSGDGKEPAIVGVVLHNDRFPRELINEDTLKRLAQWL